MKYSTSMRYTLGIQGAENIWPIRIFSIDIQEINDLLLIHWMRGSFLLQVIFPFSIDFKAIILHLIWLNLSFNWKHFILSDWIDRRESHLLFIFNFLASVELGNLHFLIFFWKSLKYRKKPKWDQLHEAAVGDCERQHKRSTIGNSKLALCQS